MKRSSSAAPVEARDPAEERRPRTPSTDPSKKTVEPPTSGPTPERRERSFDLDPLG